MNKPRGRRPVFDDPRSIATILKNVEMGQPSSRYLMNKLVNMGLVETTTVKRQGRGRPQIVYNLSEQGRRQLGTAQH
jgi:predicted ArsR family transcriptional regulator